MRERSDEVMRQLEEVLKQAGALAAQLHDETSRAPSGEPRTER